MASRDPKHHVRSDDDDRNTNQSWECSECEEENELDPDAEEGQVVACQECGTEFEIVRTSPVSLTPLSGSGNDDEGGDWEE